MAFQTGLIVDEHELRLRERVDMARNAGNGDAQFLREVRKVFRVVEQAFENTHAVGRGERAAHFADHVVIFRIVHVKHDVFFETDYIAHGIYSFSKSIIKISAKVNRKLFMLSENWKTCGVKSSEIGKLTHIDIVKNVC